MIDHVALRVRSFTRSKKFFAQALQPLGFGVVTELNGKQGGLGSAGKPCLWIAEGEPPKTPMHIAFTAKNRGAVHAFYEAALAAGGKDNGSPGVRSHYHENYYGAFVLDPDGNNIEVVCHQATP